MEDDEIVVDVQRDEEVFEMDDALVVNDNQVVLVLVFVREVLESCLHCLLPKMRMIYYRVAD